MAEIVPTSLPVRSETEAWNLLERAVRGELPAGALGVDFDGWPVLTVRLRGKPFDATLTARVMEGLVELQRTINRNYAHLRHDRASAAVLSDEERAMLEFTVRVESGSTLAVIDLTPVFNTFVERAVAKMEPTHLVGTIISVALLYAAHVAWKNYLATQLETKKVTEETRARLALSQEETRRLEILAKAVKADSSLDVASTEAGEGMNALLKGVRQAEAAEIGGIELDQETVQMAVRQKRTAAVETRMDGNFRVRKLDNSPADHYRVFVLSGEGEEFAARLDNRFASSLQEWEKLNVALKARTQAYLKINVRRVRGEIREASILEVSDAEE